MLACRLGLQGTKPRQLQSLSNISWTVRTRTIVMNGQGFDPKLKPSPTKKEKEIDEVEVAESKKTAVDLDDSEIERRVLQRRNRRGVTESKSESPFKRDSSAIAAPPSDSEFETNLIYLLASLLGFILLDGVVIAASGFLPKSTDGFIGTFLYPSFSPLVVVFLGCSTFYGVWKTRFSGQNDFDE